MLPLLLLLLVTPLALGSNCSMDTSMNQSMNDAIWEEAERRRGRMVAPDDEDQCRMLLDKFSNSSSAFTWCANQYAKPIFMCRKCVGDFLNVRTYYHALDHSEADGIHCKDILTSQDKVEIVKATYGYIVGEKGLWSKASCSSCYTEPLNHKSELTKKTVEFFALADSVMDCFEEHPNTTVEDTSTACSACRADYTALNKFYREQIFQAQFPDFNGICFDILDTMNFTQRRWGSDHYGCIRKMHTSWSLVVAIVCIMLSPVAFYGGVWYWQEAAVERAVVEHHISNAIVEEDITAEDPGHERRNTAHNLEHSRGHDQVDGWNDHEHGWER